MDDGQEPDSNNGLPFYGDHRFVAMIILSVIIATVLVTISIAMYHSSGAAQLDLSRPGYQKVRSEIVVEDKSLSAFLATGAIDQTVIDNFQDLYNQQAQKAKAIDAFGGDPLNPNTLWLTVSPSPKSL